VLGAKVNHDDWFYSRLKRTEYLSSSEIEEMQNEQLRRMIKHCYDAVPFYRKSFGEHSIRPHQVRCREDLERLPVITREDVVENHRYFISKKIPKDGIMTRYTGGTTGKPMKMMITGRERMIDNARITKQCAMAGMSMQDGQFHVGPNTGNMPWRYDRKNNAVLFSPLHFDDRNIGTFTGLLKSYGFRFMRGFPSLIYLLADHCRENGISDIRLDAVITKSEQLLPHWRKTIEDAFGCRVFDQYAQVEMVASAMECGSHSGMHVEPSFGIIETDKHNELIATSLVNYAMPLLRYRTGDIGKVAKNRCSCGRCSGRLVEFQGRKCDMIITKNGKPVNFSPVMSRIQRHQNIRECRFVQEDKGSLRVDLVIRKHESLKSIKRSLNSLFDGEIELYFNVVSSIQREGKGKSRFIISKIQS